MFIKDLYLILIMKHINFLAALPRSGTTLLGGLVNHSHLGVSPHSLLIEMIYNVYKLKDDEKYKNFPNEDSFLNVCKNITYNYYEKSKYKYILDKGPWGTPYNLEMLKKLQKNRKFVILYRNPLECLASFCKFLKNNIEEEAHFYMSDQGAIGKNLLSIRNIIDQQENFIIIYYEHFIKYPQLYVQKICEFLEIPNVTIQLNEFQFDNIQYNDSVLGAPLHKLRLDKIEKNKYDIETILPKGIIQKYKNVKII